MSNKKVLPVYYNIKLSNDEKFYEEKNIVSWKNLLIYCKEKNLKIESFKIHFDNKIKNIKRNNSKFCFVVQDLKAFGSGKTHIKKGYGSICKHPGGIKRCYIDWFDLKSGKLSHPEIIKDNKIPAFYMDISIETNV